jgi:hypothetical protein
MIENKAARRVAPALTLRGSRNGWWAGQHPPSPRFGQPGGRCSGSSIGHWLISAAVFWKKQVIALEAAATAQNAKNPTE